MVRKLVLGFIITLVFLTLFVPLSQVYAGQQQFRLGNIVVQNPEIKIHIYGNRTVQVMLVGGVEGEGVNMEYYRIVVGDGRVVLSIYTSMLGATGNLTDIEKYVFNYENKTMVGDVFAKGIENGNPFILSGKRVITFINDTSVLYRFIGSKKVVVGTVENAEKYNVSMVRRAEDILKFTFDYLWKIVRDTFTGDITAEIKIATVKKVELKPLREREYNITLVGDVDSILRGMLRDCEQAPSMYLILLRYFDRFMDKTVVTNSAEANITMNKGSLKIVFPMIRWYGGVLGDVAGFFMDNYNLSSSTPVVIVAGEGVSVSATETTLGELGEVKVEFETTTTGTQSAGKETTTSTPTTQGVSGTSTTTVSETMHHAELITRTTTAGQKQGQGINTMLYGAIAVIVAVAIAVTIAILRAKKQKQ